jgi:hypothetical protein
MAILGLKNRLLTQKSLLSDYDGATPPNAVYPDPADSLEKTQLSNYKGKTPPKYIDNAPKD